MKKKNKAIWIFAIIILSVSIWSVVFHFYSPHQIVEKIGVENSYILIFLVATFSGVSSFTSTSHYAAIVTFASGGLNIFIIALLAGIGMTIGDSLFYYLGKTGKESLPLKIKEKIQKVEDWLNSKNKIFVPISVYIYTGFTPLPGDILSVFLGVTNHKFKTVIVPILLGNITLMFLISYFAQGSS